MQSLARADTFAMSASSKPEQAALQAPVRCCRCGATISALEMRICATRAPAGGDEEQALLYYHPECYAGAGAAAGTRAAAGTPQARNGATRM